MPFLLLLLFPQSSHFPEIYRPWLQGCETKRQKTRGKKQYAHERAEHGAPQDEVLQTDPRTKKKNIRQHYVRLGMYVASKASKASKGHCGQVGTSGDAQTAHDTLMVIRSPVAFRCFVKIPLVWLSSCACDLTCLSSSSLERVSGVV